MDKQFAYRLALKADARWSAMLRDCFGNRAGDVRYTKEGKGAAGTVLRALHDDFMDATEMLRQAK